MRDADTDRPLVRLQSLDSSQGLDRLRETQQAVGGQVRAGDVLQERAEVDTGILLGVAVGS